MKSFLVTAFALVFTTAHAVAYSKSGSVYTTTGLQADVQSAINAASVGDTVNVPANTLATAFTWGDGGYVNVNKAITLNGAGIDQTFINVARTGEAGNGVIRIFAAGAVVRNMTINGPSSSSAASAFTLAGANGWRITNIKFNYNGAGAHFAYCTAYGVMDNCIINNPTAGNIELIFLRGPSDSWQTPNSMGTVNAVYIEDCTFNAVGYICDANSNSRVVVRNCTCTLEQLKIDGHGKASNTPPRGVRQIESYRNQWTQTNSNSGAWTTHELRGGTGMIWGNTNADNGAVYRGIISLKEYGALQAWGNFNSQYQTLYDYPVDDQIGVGMDPKTGGSEPMYLWSNTKNGAPVNYGWAGIAQAALTYYQTQLGYTTSITAPATVGKAFTYYFGASNSPTSYSATGLPPGLTSGMFATMPHAWGSLVGVISGTPTAAGTYPVTLSASNGSDGMTVVTTLQVGTATNTLPQIISVAGTYAFVNSAFSYQLIATNNPTAFTATNLPDGLSIDSSTGIISGTITAAAGTYPVNVTAKNAAGTTKGVLTIRNLSATGKLIINGVTFTMQDIITADRDYFSGDLLKTTFDGTTGVGTGTRVQMDAITPTKTGVGFWVTDEGEWDSTNSGPDGRLYAWSGSAWVLKYTPYAYPHPLRAGTALPAPKNLRVIQ